jgi:signal transduction histidine kinase
MTRPRRGLFWRVYATLLVSLVLVAVIGAVIWRVAAPGPMHPLEVLQGRVIGALLPPADAGPAQTRTTLARLSVAVHGRVVLKSAQGRLIAEAAQGRRLAASAPHHAYLRRFIHLADGRSLEIEAPVRIGPQHQHMVLMLLFAAVAVGIGAYPVVSSLTRRLERLRGAVEAWGGGRLQSRAAVDGRDEVAAVAEAFNAAADRVEALLAAHKALLAHASHELRSPLARLRVASEMHTAAPRPELKAAIEREVAELDVLVDEILLASRLDHGGDMGPPEPVDLLALAAEEAARAGVELRAVKGAAGAFELRGWPRLLRRMIRNLVQNAVQHGGPPVEVELGRETDEGASTITLAVHDCGPGIPPEECERVFDPFHRPPGRPETEGSWGLGLSLVRQIAGRHGGVAACEPRPGGGTTFKVALPASAAGRADKRLDR